MANLEHLERLKRGVAWWNEWCTQHQEIRPHLSETNLSGTEPDGTDLHEECVHGMPGDKRIQTHSLILVMPI